MSRSHKKAIVQGAACKDLKKVANHVVRQKPTVPQGKSYKKFFQSWDICDMRYDMRFEPQPYRHWTRKLFKQKDKNQFYKMWK
jgi:hypothetical protein